MNRIRDILKRCYINLIMKEFSLFVQKLIVVFLLALISACATQNPSIVEDSTPVLNKNRVALPVGKGAVTTHIDADVLYMLMMAEIAGQREQYGVALEGYLQAAKRVSDPKIAERAAKIAFFLKDNQKADEAVTLWLANDPQNLTARKLAVFVAVRKADAKQAIKHLEYLLKADPAGFEGVLIDVVKLMGREGGHLSSDSLLAGLGSKHPDNATILYVQAYVAMQNKQLNVAQQKIQQVLELQPGWTKAMVFQAQLAAMSGNYEKAIAVLRDASAMLPENLKIKKMLAQVLVKSGQYDEAGDIYQEMLAQDSNNAEDRFALALINLELKRDDKAKQLLEDLTNQPAWRAQASFYLGKLAARHEQNDDALIWFDSVTNGVLVFDAKVHAFSLLLKLKRFDEAKQRLEAMQKLFPAEKLRLILLAAELYNKQKLYQQAFDVLTSGLLKMPEQKELLYTRALIAERLNKLDILESDLKFILEKNPDDANALNALGYTLADRTDRIEEAEQYLNKAIALQPNEPVIQDSYGWLQFKLGRLEKAKEYLQKAYDQAKEGEIAAHLVEVLWRLGKKEQALKLLNNALNSKPGDEYLLEVQSQIKQ